MEIWSTMILTFCIAVLFNALFSSSKPRSNLPPGPRGVPIISSILWFRKSYIEMEEILKKLGPKFGGIVTFYMGSRPWIFISNRTLAHEALIQQGAIFANRPEAPFTNKVMTSNQHNITFGLYGPVWRVLRRNLTSQIVHPSKYKEFSSARKWTLNILLTHLKENLSSSLAREGLKVVDHFRFAMFCLLVFMCFGDKMDEKQIREVLEAVHKPMASFSRYQILNFLPWMTKFLLRSRWDEFIKSRKKQEDVLIPYIRARKQLQKKGACYMDTLLDLKVSEDDNSERKLSEEEIVSVCSEFFTAGTDTTSTALQWILANVIKYPQIQAKLLEEIKGVVGKEAEEVGEDDLSKMPYLKAVVLEGLRRHPPGHFVLPHAVTEQTKLGGYTVPKNAIIIFVAAEMGLDPEAWDDPMEFRPERFMASEEEFDITGSREIKMMPFGVGRRICPAAGLALLHLEYFLANLVWKYEWKIADGKDVDLSEKQEFTIVMKYPLRVHISLR